MPIYPATVKNFSVYGPTGVEVGVADITLPHLQWEKDTLKGAMLAGSANLGVEGNAQPMETTITFHTNTKQSLSFFSGGGQRIRCLSSIYMCDTSSGEIDEQPEEVIMTVWGAGYNLGKREPSTKGGVSLSFDVTYLALYFSGVKWWEIDFWNNVAICAGRDLNAKTRANL
jgi:P2 family phage contractile tail tube protein